LIAIVTKSVLFASIKNCEQKSGNVLFLDMKDFFFGGKYEKGWDILKAAVFSCI
jgi:hypothetical protein